MIYSMLLAPIIVVTGLFFFLHRETACAECGRKLPAPRFPRSLKQAFWGGWNCPNCGAELDGAGRTLAKPGRICAKGD